MRVRRFVTNERVVLSPGQGCSRGSPSPPGSSPRSSSCWSKDERPRLPHRRDDGRRRARGDRRVLAPGQRRLEPCALLVGRRAVPPARRRRPQREPVPRAPCSTHLELPGAEHPSRGRGRRGSTSMPRRPRLRAELARLPRRARPRAGLRHHLPGRRTGRAHRLPVPRPSGDPDHGTRAVVGAGLPEAAAGAAHPHAAGHQLLGAGLARAGRCRQGVGARARAGGRQPPACPPPESKGRKRTVFFVDEARRPSQVPPELIGSGSTAELDAAGQS